MKTIVAVLFGIFINLISIATFGQVFETGLLIKQGGNTWVTTEPLGVVETWSSPVRMTVIAGGWQLDIWSASGGNISPGYYRASEDIGMSLLNPSGEARLVENGAILVLGYDLNGGVNPPVIAVNVRVDSSTEEEIFFEARQNSAGLYPTVIQNGDTPVVPEPKETAVAFGVGLLGAIWFRRKNQKG